jgi:hypothetical protein
VRERRKLAEMLVDLGGRLTESTNLAQSENPLSERRRALGDKPIDTVELPYGM